MELGSYGGHIDRLRPHRATSAKEERKGKPTPVDFVDEGLNRLGLALGSRAQRFRQILVAVFVALHDRPKDLLRLSRERFWILPGGALWRRLPVRWA